LQGTLKQRLLQIASLRQSLSSSLALIELKQNDMLQDLGDVFPIGRTSSSKAYAVIALDTLQQSSFHFALIGIHERIVAVVQCV
jgi:hypothetical protein